MNKKKKRSLTTKVPALAKWLFIIVPLLWIILPLYLAEIISSRSLWYVQITEVVFYYFILPLLSLYWLYRELRNAYWGDLKNLIISLLTTAILGTTLFIPILHDVTLKAFTSDLKFTSLKTYAGKCRDEYPRSYWPGECVTFKKEEDKIYFVRYPAEGLKKGAVYKVVSLENRFLGYNIILEQREIMRLE